MDGLTLARAIKVDPLIAETRVVILTTLNQNVETSLLHAARVGACLTKPIKQSRLMDYLLAALSEQGLPRPSATRLVEEAPSLQAFGSIAANGVLRILVAEDNPINQKVARGLLARFGYPSEVVDTGRKLLRAVELAPFDIIFVDCQLPELDGLQATRELRRREMGGQRLHRTYVIAMTADAAPGARERCLESGMDDYLSKPVRLDELHAALRRAVEFVNLAASRQEHRVVAGWIDPSVM